MRVEDTPPKLASPPQHDGEDNAIHIDAPSRPHSLVATTTPPSSLPTAPFPTITLEQCLYILIGIVSIIIHLWALGDRALHHDETLHAFYSWKIYQGDSYMHDPLLHGPFLYFFGALIYFLFGDSDFTARVGAALFGAVLPLLPFLVRREMGRPAALIAALYLLISPAFLYVGRFIRHDIYSIVFEMLVFIAVLRYSTTRQPRWLYIGVAAFALMLTNQETSYLFLLMMATPLVGLFLWRVYKPGIVLVGGLAVMLAALVFVLPGEAEVDGGHHAIRDPETNEMQYEPGVFGLPPLPTDDNAYALKIRHRADNDGGRSLLENSGRYVQDLWLFFGHPAILTAIGLLLLTIGVLVWQIWFFRGKDTLTAWQRACGGAGGQSADSICATYASLGRQWRWLIALAIALVIYLLLFTAFFTNLIGSVSGITGSLLYWLAQHNVERGGQPAYYYLVLLFIYEPLLLVWSGAGLLILLVQWIRRGSRDNWHLLPMLLAWWSITALGIYSWAGEKMPWLLVHVALPLVLFSAWAMQEFGRFALSSYRRIAAPPGNAVAASSPGPEHSHDAMPQPTDPGHHPPHHIERFVIFAGIFAFAVGFCFVQLTTATRTGIRWEWFNQEVPLIIFPGITLVFLLWLTIAATISWGWRWSLGALVLCITLTGSLYTIRNSYRVTYLIGDVPREMLIYTQTSPDVPRFMRGLEEVSMRRTSGLDMPVIYDNETISQWYFRNFTEAQRVSPPLNTSDPPGDEVQAMLLLSENLSGPVDENPYLAGFCARRFPLRWWFPEAEMYELHDDPQTPALEWLSDPAESVSLLARTLRNPFADETIIDLWNFLVHRDTAAALGSSDFVMAVRPEIAHQVSPGLCGDP